MGGFDWIIAAIFLVSVLVGIMRGFIKESLSIISWIMAIWLAIYFGVKAGDFLGQYIDIPTPVFRVWAGRVLVFIAMLFLFAFLSYVITKVFVRGPIKGTDRVLGVGFGALRATAILIAVLLVARGFGMESSEWWKNSSYLPRLLPFVNQVEEWLPSDFQRDIESDETLQDKAIKKALEILPKSSTAET